MKVLDGSTGEGGGQILRTALFLSILTGEPIRVEKIRRGRHKPGLKPQHVGILQLLGQLSGSRARGVSPGSTTVEFEPAPPRPGSYRFDVGTAGCLALFLQTLLPVCLVSSGSIRLELIGGTDVRGGPTIEWLRHVLVPRLLPLAKEIELEILRHGFEPAGGGRVRLRVEPLEGATTVEGLRRILHDRGSPAPPRPRSPASIGGVSVAHEHLEGVAQRQAEAAAKLLGEAGLPPPEIDAKAVPADSPGTSLTLWMDDVDGTSIGGDALGRRGLPAEEVGRAAATRLLEDWRTGATVDRHLADHLVPWIALGMEPVRVPRATGHLETNVWVSNQLLAGHPIRLRGQVLEAGAR